MGNASDVPELGEDDTAFCVHRLGYLTPPFDLRLAVNAWRPGITLAAGLDLRALGDHETSAGTLLVIPRHHAGRHVAGLLTALARQRRQDNAVFQDMVTE